MYRQHSIPMGGRPSEDSVPCAQRSSPTRPSQTSPKLVERIKSRATHPESSTAAIKQNGNGGRTEEHRAVDALLKMFKDEFGGLLVKLNNTTASEMREGFASFDKKLEESLRMSDAAERAREARVQRLERLCQRMLDRAAENDPERRGGDDDTALSRIVCMLDGLLPGVNSRLDNIVQRLDSNDAFSKELQTSFKRRFETLESSACSHSTPPTTPRQSGKAAPMKDVILALQDEFRKNEMVLARLGKAVSAARDEAHLDKEQLAGIFEERYQEVSSVLSRVKGELGAIKKAVEDGTESKNIQKDDKESSFSQSLPDRIGSLSLELHDALKQFREAKAARDKEGPSSLKSALETILEKRSFDKEPKPNHREVGTMTEDLTVGVTNDTKDDHTDSILCVKQTAGLVENPSPPKGTSESQTKKTFVPPLDMNSIDFMMPDESSYENNSASTDNRDTHSSLQFSIPSSSITSFDQELRPEPAIDAEETTPVLSRSMSMLPYDVNAVVDPRKTLMSPPPSSVEPSFSRSPSSCLKRKEPDNTQDGSIPQQNIGIDVTSLFGGASPSYWPDKARSVSPLTPIASEGGLSDQESDLTDLISEEEQQAQAQAQKEVSDTASSQTCPFPCPNNCGKLYSARSSLWSHKKICPNGPQDETASGPSSPPKHSPKRSKEKHSASVRSKKRRKLSHNGGGSSNSQPTKNKRREGNMKTEELDSPPELFSYPPDVLSGCIWPKKTNVNETFNRQFLICDRCESMYHYQCVAVKKDDPRLKPDVPFVCPPCEFVNDPNQIVNASGRKTCSRPNCDWPKEASDDDEDYFIVESIIGRSVVNTKKPGSRKLAPMWLVKWQGYPVKECDWLEEENIPDVEQFIGRFYERARAEGIKVADENSVYLLKEARSQLHLAMRGKWKWV